MLGLIAFAVLGAAGAGYYFPRQSSSGASETAWESIDPNDATALRAFIHDNSRTARASEACLAELEEHTFNAVMDSQDPIAGAIPQGLSRTATHEIHRLIDELK